jgi:hypothetical protein
LRHPPGWVHVSRIETLVACRSIVPAVVQPTTERSRAARVSLSPASPPQRSAATPCAALSVSRSGDPIERDRGGEDSEGHEDQTDQGRRAPAARPAYVVSVSLRGPARKPRSRSVSS